ncbi:ferric reductase-like transmembrane domain-containing protein [Paramesorhizobium deserti]|uniref:ferric reductase-like transmembrane domain-containing protein n=1 Tax=Paramesorhizobium deserti TaxID=1494590 RepID=UPI000A94DF84
MANIKRTFWGILGLLSVLWIFSEPQLFQSAGFLAFREIVVQYSGIIAMAGMSMAMVLALRPRWPEGWLGGLDKMYRLHKWLGIGVLVVAVLHWLWAKGPKWAVGWGLIERRARGTAPVLENPIEQFFMTLRGSAEGIGEWAFYAAVLLIALALIKRFPYRLFYKTHRLLALAYLVLVFHAIVLVKFSYWTAPVGIVMAPLLAAGTYAAFIVLLRRVGVSRQVQGRITSMQYYLGVRNGDRGAAWLARSQAWPVRLRHFRQIGRRASLHHRVRME